jgi:hypothetical protein
MLDVPASFVAVTVHVSAPIVEHVPLPDADVTVYPVTGDPPAGASQRTVADRSLTVAVTVCGASGAVTSVNL